MKNAYFAFKNRQNAHFLKKKSLKNLVIQKKSSTFAPAFRGMLLAKRNNCGNSSVGRAQPCQGWGRGSESRFPLNFFLKQHQVLSYVLELM